MEIEGKSVTSNVTDTPEIKSHYRSGQIEVLIMFRHSSSNVGSEDC